MLHWGQVMLYEIHFDYRDEPDIQELLRAYLEDAGYRTAVAGDGVAALERFGYFWAGGSI